MIGQHVGHYLIEASLGRGGMGVVYRATDTRLRRTVAIKILPEDAHSSVERKRFLREAQAASALSHPGIVTVHDVDHDRGVDFIVMEHVDGRTLREILEAGPLPVEDALDYTRQAAAALAAAHAAGIVHRDLKPQNIMVTAGGQLKILDFGLAQVDTGELNSLQSTEQRLTALGTVVGTPGYMSPEQAEGQPISARTDVFSLGVILYEMLTGKTPFRGASVPRVLYAIVHRVPEPAADLRPGLSREVTDVLDTMLRKDPRQRYADGGEVLRALSGERVQTQGAARLGGWRRPRWWPIVAALLAVAAAGGLWIARSPRSREAPAVAAPGAATALDLYLKGLDLMERWDREDNLAEAARLFSEAARQDPGFALAFARLADAQRIQYALTRDEARLAEAARNAAEAVSLNADLAPVQVALGRIQAMQGHNDLAFAAFERALAIDPNSAAANQAIARLYERQGRLQDAEAAHCKAISLEPESTSILDSYANFLFRQSRFQDATREWQAVVRLAPDNVTALGNLGSALSESGRIAEAITVLQRAVELNPTPMAHSNLGTAYSRAERYPEAVDSYRRALELDDRDWLAWGNLGYVYAWMGGRDAEAARAFEQAIRLAEAERRDNPRDALVHSDLALYYAKTGNPELAVARLKTALTLSPDVGEVQAAAAEVYENVGRREDGIESARRALELGYPRQRLQRNPELSRLLTDPRMASSGSR